MKLIIKNNLIKRIENNFLNKETNKMELRKFPVMVLNAQDKYYAYIPVFKLNVIQKEDALFSMYIKENETFTVYNGINQAKKECNIQEFKNIFGLEELIEENKNMDEF